MIQEELSKVSAKTPLLSVIDSYLKYYAVGSSHTARAKRLDLHKFTDFLTDYYAYSKSSKLTLSDWTHSAIQRFIEDLLTKGESPATVGRRLATLKHIGRTYAEKIPGFINPAKEVKTPKISAPQPKALSAEELDKIKLKALARLDEKSSFIRYRNLVILNFLLETGLRADEIRLLKLSQIDDSHEWIKNIRTKGKRYRNAYIASTLRPALNAYLVRRQQELARFFPKLHKNIDKQLPLFISTYGAKPEDPDSFRLGPKTLWRAIHELSAKVGLHPHLLRHTFALDLLDSSKDIRLVSQALGHGDVKITMRYTERTDLEIAAALEKSRKEK